MQELSQMVAPQIELVSLKEIGCLVEIPETGDTLQANALQKALYIKEKFGVNCFADDTGLEVESLGGAPGVYSARYAGEPSNSENNIKLLLSNLESHENREAQFRTVIALLLNDDAPRYFEGIVKGNIINTPRGNEGFGYDPVFIPIGFHHTFAEMTTEEKNSISHRSLAVKQLVDFLSNLTQ